LAAEAAAILAVSVSVAASSAYLFVNKLSIAPSSSAKTLATSVIFAINAALVVPTTA